MLQFDQGQNLSFCKELTLSQISPGFYVSAVQVFWKHSEKRRNCSQRAISPFPTVFSTHFENFAPFSSNWRMSSANSFSLEKPKICRLGRVKVILTIWRTLTDSFKSSISVMSRRSLHLSLLSWSSFAPLLQQYSFRPPSAFPHNHRRNKGQWWHRDEFCLNDNPQSSERSC